MRVARRTCASCTCSPNIIALYARERAGSENVDIRRSGSRFEEAEWKSAAEMVELPLEARCVTFSDSRRHNRGSIPIERRAKLTLGQVAAERKVGSRVTARSNLARKIYAGFLGRPRIVWGGEKAELTAADARVRKNYNTAALLNGRAGISSGVPVSIMPAARLRIKRHALNGNRCKTHFPSLRGGPHGISNIRVHR